MGCLEPTSAPFATPGNGSVSALAMGTKIERDNAISEIGTKRLKLITSI
jgi:hypothetical protein